MSRITTGQLFAEWQQMNQKLLTQIEKQDEIIAKQQALIDRFNSPIDTQLTGSNVEDGIAVNTVNNNELIIASRGVEITAGSGYYLLRNEDVTNYTKLYAYVLSSGRHDFRLTFDFKDGQSSSGVTPYVKTGESYDSEGDRTINVDIMDVTFPQVDIYIRNRSEQTHKYDGVVRGLKS